MCSGEGSIGRNPHEGDVFGLWGRGEVTRHIDERDTCEHACDLVCMFGPVQWHWH